MGGLRVFSEFVVCAARITLLYVVGLAMGTGCKKADIIMKVRK
jgi:hypothetical protein